jgi:hypothetical protein
MIVEDEKEEDIEHDLDMNETPTTVVVQEPEFSFEDQVPFQRVLEKGDDIQSRAAHIQLKDLVEHIWNKFGCRRNASRLTIYNICVIKFGLVLILNLLYNIYANVCIYTSWGLYKY